MPDERKRKLRSIYAAALPAAMVQGAFNFPKGYADASIEKASRKAFKLSKLPGSTKARGFGRAAGGLTASMATLPIFMKGVSSLGTAKTKTDKAKGYATVGASAAIYGGLKGGIEKSFETRSAKAGKAAAVKAIKKMMKTRGMTSMAHGLLMAGAIGKSRRKKDSASKSIARAAAVGGGAGAIKGFVDIAYPEMRRVARNPKLLQRAISGAGGRAASGVIGAVVLDRLAGQMLKKSSEKRASQEAQQAAAIRRPPRVARVNATADQLGAEAQRRYGKKAPKFAKKVGEIGEDISRIAGDGSKVKVQMGPGRQSSAGQTTPGEGMINLGESSRATAQHEAGHIKDPDLKKREGFGDRMFGGTKSNVLDSEFYATRQAQKDGKTPKSLLRATSTYVHGNKAGDFMASPAQSDYRRALDSAAKRTSEGGKIEKQEAHTEKVKRVLHSRRPTTDETDVAEKKLKALQTKRIKTGRGRERAIDLKYGPFGMNAPADKKAKIDRIRKKIAETRWEYIGHAEGEAAASKAKHGAKKSALMKRLRESNERRAESIGRKKNPYLNTEIVGKMTPDERKGYDKMNTEIEGEFSKRYSPGEGKRYREHLSEMAKEKPYVSSRDRHFREVDPTKRKPRPKKEPPVRNAPPVKKRKLSPEEVRAKLKSYKLSPEARASFKKVFKFGKRFVKRGSEKTAVSKGLIIGAGVAGVAGVLGMRTFTPVQVPVRGGVLTMRRGTVKRVKRAIRSGDSMTAASVVSQGLRTGKIRYHKFSSPAVAKTMSFAKKASILKRVGGNVLRGGQKALNAAPKYLDGMEIPVAFGALVLGGVGYAKLRRAMLNAKYRRAQAAGRLPTGVQVVR